LAYLPAELIKGSVTRLGGSRAQSRLLEYLIFKRAWILSGGGTARVVTGTKSDSFQRAIQEWASVGQNDSGDERFFNPISAVTDKTGGYRTFKYASNGPSDTISGWQGSFENPPFLFVKGTSPKEYTYAPTPIDELQKIFLRAESLDPAANRKPGLADIAVWWFRSRELEDLDTNYEIEPEILVNALREEVGLEDAEIEALFELSQPLA
jgi:hypothetical protein